MRKYINLINEAVGDDIAMNNRINAVLETLPEEDRQMVLYGIDLIKDAGPTGMSGGEWGAQMRNLYFSDPVQTGSPTKRDVTSFSAEYLGRIMRTILNDFGFCVRRENGYYVWSTPSADDSDVDPNLRAVAGLQIEIVYRVLDEMKRMGRFTQRDIMMILATMGLDPAMARTFAEHILQQFQSSIVADGDGYRFIEKAKPTAADHMNRWRDLAARGGDPDTSPDY